jgi:hypothetical protein
VSLFQIADRIRGLAQRIGSLDDRPDVPEFEFGLDLILDGLDKIRTRR